MKKFGLLAVAAAAMIGTSAASAQEITFVEDCSQGLLQNRAKDNWFMTLQGGANMYFSTNDVYARIQDRIAPQGSLYFGKWINPSLGIRFGANWMMAKGATQEFGFARDYGYGPLHPRKGEEVFYPEKFMGLGPEFNILVNLTNWWCGYKPNRVYNAVLHGGAGFYWTWIRHHEGQGIYNTTSYDANKPMEWLDARNTFMFGEVGLQNNFRVSKHVELFLDVTGKIMDFDNSTDRPYKDYGVSYTASVNAGVTINFGGKDNWVCPVMAVCPTWKYTDAEGDALAARLAQSDKKIKDLQGQLDACLNRPVVESSKKEVKRTNAGSTVVVNECEGLVTIYYPINVSTLTKNDKMVLNSVAKVMNNHPEKTYVLTGWADNYTGTDAINTRLRNERVNGVKDYLIKVGVPATQLDATIDNGNLTDLGVKAAPLDRAVTIREKE